MKKTIFWVIFLFNIINSFAQCKEYIRSIAAESIKPYMLDMNFFAPVVTEGDKIVYTRAFIKGNRYIIKVIGLEFLEKKIKITDQDGILLFANYNIRWKKIKNKYFTDYQGNKIMWLESNYYEFIATKTENLKITIRIEKKAKRRKNRLKGCLGIIIGYMPIKK